MNERRTFARALSLNLDPAELSRPSLEEPVLDGSLHRLERRIIELDAKVDSVRNILAKPRDAATHFENGVQSSNIPKSGAQHGPEQPSVAVRCAASTEIPIEMSDQEDAPKEDTNENAEVAAVLDWMNTNVDAQEASTLLRIDVVDTAKLQESATSESLNSTGSLVNRGPITDTLEDTQNAISGEIEPYRIWIEGLEVDESCSSNSRRTRWSNGAPVSTITKTQMDKLDEHGDASQCVIHPSAKSKLAWDLLGLVLIAFDVIWLPFQIFFNPSETDTGQFPLYAF
jgi:hypothetical protein